jgi:hypothetical protein
LRICVSVLAPLPSPHDAGAERHRALEAYTQSSLQVYKSQWGTNALRAASPHGKMFGVKDAYGNGGGSVSMSAMSERMNTAGGLREGRPPRGKLPSNTPKPPPNEQSAAPRKPAERERDKEQSQALVLPDHMSMDRVGSGDSVDNVTQLDHLIGRHTNKLSRLSSGVGSDTDGGGGREGGREGRNEGGREEGRETRARNKGDKEVEKGAREEWERRMARREGGVGGQSDRGTSGGIPLSPRRSAKEVIARSLWQVCWLSAFCTSE